MYRQAKSVDKKNDMAPGSALILNVFVYSKTGPRFAVVLSEGIQAQVKCKEAQWQLQIIYVPSA